MDICLNTCPSCHLTGDDITQIYSDERFRELFEKTKEQTLKDIFINVMKLTEEQYEKYMAKIKEQSVIP